MSYTKATFLALLTAVSAHGTVSGVVANGQFHRNYNPSFQFFNPEPAVPGWRVPLQLDNGFVDGTVYTSPDIICHKSASNPLGAAIPVNAGSSIELQWTPWPESHKGPVIDYLASCNGDCAGVDKTQLNFFKIAEKGLIDGRNAPGIWAADELIKNNNTHVLQIPADIAPGEYVLRHEIIALHSSGELNGAQNYPQCINIKVSGPGTAKPAGVKGTALYKNTDPGILFNIYRTISEYVIPGPALYKSGSAPAPAPGPGTTAPAPAPTGGSGDGEDEDTVGQPQPTPGAGDSECAPSTVTVAGPTVTVAAQTVTITQSGPAVTVTVAPQQRPMPSGATLDDLLRWVGNKVGGGGLARRHARALRA